MSNHLPPSSSADSQFAAARQRLDRLEGFVRADPRNTALLIDAFETALSCQDWERAQFHLRHGQSLRVDPWGWRLREGDYWLAQGRYEEARALLESLAAMGGAPAGFDDVVRHNLAFVDFRQGRLDRCIERLAPMLSSADGSALAGPAAPVGAAMQALWVRALHHGLQLERAMTWAHSAERLGLLQPSTAGIASLVAIDASDSAAAQRWSSRSLESAGTAAPVLEALVAQASLALGARDESRARHLIQQALQQAPNDGRSQSVLAFADLLGGRLGDAASGFSRALDAMPDHIGTWHGYAWTRLLSHDVPGARAAFEHALSLDRNFAESHGGLAVTLALQGDALDARTSAELALRLDPHNVSGRYAQALLNGKIRGPDDLRRLAGRLLAGVKGPSGEDLGDIF